MPTKTLVSIVALAMAVATATQARAGAWSSVASGCVLQSDANTPNLAIQSAVYGLVAFADGKSGDIKLTCPVQGTFGAGSAFFLTFYNDNGFAGSVDHCYIRADFLRTNLDNIEIGGDLGSITTEHQIFTGRSVLVGALSEFVDFSRNYYWVDIELFRDSPSAICNPIVVGTFLSQPE
jgi:hypothetical protein